MPPTGRLVARGVRPSLSIDVVSSVPGDMFTQMRTALVQERILALQAAGEVKLAVYDLSGQLVKTLVAGAGITVAVVKGSVETESSPGS